MINYKETYNIIQFYLKEEFNPMQIQFAIEHSIHTIWEKYIRNRNENAFIANDVKSYFIGNFRQKIIDTDGIIDIPENLAMIISDPVFKVSNRQNVEISIKGTLQGWNTFSLTDPKNFEHDLYGPNAQCFLAYKKLYYKISSIFSPISIDFSYYFYKVQYESGKDIDLPKSVMLEFYKYCIEYLSKKKFIIDKKGNIKLIPLVTLNI